MKGMFKRLFIFFFILFYCLDLLPQEAPQHNRKIYDTWISLRNEPERSRGVLYEVRDSSVFLSDSRFRNDYLAGNYSLREFNYLDINRLVIRRKNAEITGALIGGGVAGLLAVLFINDNFKYPDISREEMSAYYLYIGTPITLLGFGLGGIIGYTPIRIPIHGNYERFNSQRRKLINKALLVHDLEDILRNDPYLMEHSSYVGWLIGPSAPVGAFAGASSNGNNWSPKTGYSSDFSLGLKLRAGFMISLSRFSNSYNLADANQDILWDLSGFSIGPMFGFSLTEKTFLDLIPNIGIMSAHLWIEDGSGYGGNGIAINPRIAFRYNVASRWVLMTKGQYMYAIPFKGDQDAPGMDLKNFQTLNLGLGVGYRFR